MKESQREAKNEVSSRDISDNKAEKRTVTVEKPTTMPNPVKGLCLSLYPMIKEH